MLGKYALKAQRHGQHFNALFCRKELPMLDDAIERSHEIYSPLGAKWNEQKKSWRFPWGGRVRFRPLEKATDAEKYQGQNVTDACVEELGNYADPAPFDRLNGILRSAHGVPTQLLGTGNPGGPGQLWLKARYVDPAPLGMKILRRPLPNGKEHRYVYIPSKVGNNRILLAKDPEYINRLYLVGSEQLVQAWLAGDWSAIAGAFFPEFSIARHVVPPVQLPAYWTRFGAFDWGSARPFSYGIYAVSDGELSQFPRGALIRYREWYGVKKKPDGSIEPNVGLKLTAEEIGDGIRQLEGDERISYRVADPSIFSEDGGPSHAERLLGRGVTFRRADNARVPLHGHIGGWDQVRARLKGQDDGPMVFMFGTSEHLIRTLPAMQHDQLRAEDLDSDGEDHAVDELRYACMSRPYTRPKPVPPQPLQGIREMTFDQLIKHGAPQKSARIR